MAEHFFFLNNALDLGRFTLEEFYALGSKRRLTLQELNELPFASWLRNERSTPFALLYHQMRQGESFVSINRSATKGRLYWPLWLSVHIALS